MSLSTFIIIWIMIQIIKSIFSLYRDGSYRNYKRKNEINVHLFFFLCFFTVNWTTFDQSCRLFLCEEHARCHTRQAATATHLTFVWLYMRSAHTATASSPTAAANKPMENSPTQGVFIVLGMNGMRDEDEGWDLPSWKTSLNLEVFRGGDPTPHLAWDHLCIPQEELEMNLVDMSVWNTLLNLLTPRPDPR